MIDFLLISTRPTKNGAIEIYPKFKIIKSKDLMTRGGDFYAVWDEERGLWSTDEQDLIHIIDHELDRYAEENAARFNNHYRVLHLWDAETGMIDSWHRYCQKQMRDSFHMLDEKLVFSNSETNKSDYASKRLSYPLEEGPHPAFDKLISTLYDDDERHKIEWVIGSIISGDSKKIQKFLVLYGESGTGKSTILNIIQDLFDGYYGVFDAKALGSSSNSFALESFKTNPLVAIQHDGDLSRIEDNTRLNSLVSHEFMTVNEKFKSTYPAQFKSFLFLGTNKPVKITDSKSGLIRRLIDVTPSGNKIPIREYNNLIRQVKFELGAIAKYCLDVYLDNPGAYDNYIPVNMLGASNDFYNFIEEYYFKLKEEDGITLKAAWDIYKLYCEEARVSYPLSQRSFKEEMKTYFREFHERYALSDGSRPRNYYRGFRSERFEKSSDTKKKEENITNTNWLSMNYTESIFDSECTECLAQYATYDGTPIKKWSSVKTKLSSINTSQVHFVMVPEQHIVIDFDIRDNDGNKSYEANAKAASSFPPTYAELSKSGGGIHLHYLYSGDPAMLSRIYAEHIEIKVFTGNSSLRRKLTKCNDLPIAMISSGLPLKGDKMINFDRVQTEKGLRVLISRNLKKEIHPATKPSIDFIYKLLDDAYNSGMEYDVSDMRQSILTFAANSSNQADYCIKMIGKMPFKSEKPLAGIENTEAPIVFFDVEVFPNLFVVNWKFAGDDQPMVRMINPTAAEVEALFKYRLIAFNNRRYDNHILYAASKGFTLIQLFNLSQKIIGNEKNCMFGEAYNLSYTDIYDFASASNKKSLKKWEIELGIKHHELGLAWDKPVPEEKWLMVAEYCDDDVLAAEKVFNHLSGDWTARQILAAMAGMTVNDTTNALTTRIIFGSNRRPQSEFNYRDLSKPVKYLDDETLEFLQEAKPKMMAQKHCSFEQGVESLLPYFPGYEYVRGKSTYRGEEIGEGGRVYAEPGIYGFAALLDIVSQHPNSAIAEVIFGVEFTKRFKEIVDGRVGIKHEAWAIVNGMLDGILTPFIQRVIDGEMTAGQLANALKTAINSVYGLTCASFDNAFKDPRNKDNIVAKRGALFMTDLKFAVQERGFTVAHIKTDSIKIPDATPEIIDFVMEFGALYGYDFEHEATYDRMCLVNDAVYIAKYATPETCMRLYNYVPGDCNKKGGKWTATGTQFAVPYVLKTLFTHEDIVFEDLCETKSVTSSLYLDLNEKLPDVSAQEKQLSKLESDYKKGLLSDTMFESLTEGLYSQIETGHDYHFVGKVGSFCPIKTGCGGGVLLREKDGKYYSATGAKDYRWLEAEQVKASGVRDCIDEGYHRALVDKAVETIDKFGDFEWFVSDEPYIPPSYEKGNYMDHPCYDAELPWN